MFNDDEDLNTRNLIATDTQPKRKERQQVEIVTRLTALEGSFLNALQQIRQIREELGRRITEGGTLERLLDAQEVADILGVEINYVYALARKKKIPSIRVGDKYVKFSPSQLKNFLTTARDQQAE